MKPTRLEWNCSHTGTRSALHDDIRACQQQPVDFADRLHPEVRRAALIAGASLFEHMKLRRYDTVTRDRIAVQAAGIALRAESVIYKVDTTGIPLVRMPQYDGAVRFHAQTIAEQPNVRSQSDPNMSYYLAAQSRTITDDPQLRAYSGVVAMTTVVLADVFWHSRSESIADLIMAEGGVETITN